MTTTKTRKSSDPKSKTDIAELVASGAVTIEAIDVATAQLDPNVRTDATYTAEFADSIATDGVRDPVYGRREPDGTVYVWDGQRRTLAAKEAGLDTMLGIFGLTPASVKDSQRVLDQLRTFNRDNLALTDRIAAYEQLTLDGISDIAIARATGQSRDLVKQTITVAKSASAKQAAADHGQLSLDKLMLIAEFDGDQDAVEQIAQVEDDDELPYLAQEIRDDRAIRAATARLVDQITATGMQVFTEWGGFRHLDRLTDAPDDADERPALTPETHTQCEGRGMYLSIWGTGNNDYRAEEVCARPDLHHDIWAIHGHSELVVPADETDDQREAREQAEAATRKAERARVLKNNKAWRTATTVRRDWITTLLSRKRLPIEHAVFVAQSLTEHAQAITDYKAGDLVGPFLGQANEFPMRSAAAKLVEAAPTRAGHVTLAVVLAAREARAEDVEGWRRPTSIVASYLLQLEAWGFTLSPVERIAAGYPEPESDDDYTENTSAETDSEEPQIK